jgi:endogenous inhibitor of DNA gyrase (YacG/DUF329 family)
MGEGRTSGAFDFRPSPFYFLLVMKRCPYCKKPVEFRDNPFRPFCSERCKLLDLGHWVDGDYRVPAQEERPSAEQLTGGPDGADTER